MTDTAQRQGRGARLRRAVLVLLAAVVVLGPIPVGLVWAWRVHPLLVVPAYLIGIAAWLVLLSGAWSLVQRVRGALTGRRTPAQEPAEQPAEPQPDQPVAPAVRSQVRMPSPRAEATAPQRVS
ncbi:hypothetical protein [Nocardioides sp.]|jgi:hypothetical protein|uniref:hypothetical protein n=1 Tax=Nocardioides sp. TaxID=35761 RepID=UPI00261CD527|nr:hypothetical protein [Nocardioides sp.]